MDSADRSRIRRLILISLLLALPADTFPQDLSPPLGIADLRALYDSGRWEAVVQSAPESPNNPSEVELYRGLALARLQRWADARKAFESGFAKSPRDPRFLEELAGVEYKQKQFSRSKRDLRHALVLEPQNYYVINFLASIYFLEDNLEAALKYWNRIDKPHLSNLSFESARFDPLILDRAFAFSQGGEWRGEQFLATKAQLENLGVFARLRFGLTAEPGGSFQLTFDSTERNLWPYSKWEWALSSLRGLPYQTVYPEFYNLNHAALNWRSQIRWDRQKRRIYSEIAAPLREDPRWRYRIYFDGRDENWNLTNTFFPASPAPAGLNLAKAEFGAELQSVPSGLWNWSAGILYSDRRLRNLQGLSAQAASFFTNGGSLAYRARVDRFLIRLPERRFTVDSSATGEIGTFLQSPLGRYGRLRGELDSQWLPKSRGDDYETHLTLRAGWTSGAVPFDELFVLGFDRDTDLWMRGHPGLVNGEKGSAPMGRNYLLSNIETTKIVFAGHFLELRAGPFLDSGEVYDPSGFFGSANWLWDTGIEMKLRVFGSFEFILGYGKDLRTGVNSLFTTVGP